MQLSENAKTVLEKRYLKKVNGKPTESPEDLLWRVADNIAQVDNIYYSQTNNKIKEITQDFFESMDKMYFLPNSPTLMNAGRELQQLSACFVLPIEDSMDSIFESIKNAALIHKSGGGTGFSFSRLRPKNDIVLSTGGVASGPVSFMEVFNSATEAVKQGGTRRGANMGILKVDHPDIKEFITCKRDSDKINNFNISVAITDDFMEALIQDKNYSLVNPKDDRVVDTLAAREVFDKIVDMAWKNGEPGIIFLDRINAYNPTPHIGEIESTNPCFHPETMVSTEKGLESIEELYYRVGDEPFEVLVDNRAAEVKTAVNESNSVEFGTSRQMARVFPTGKKEVVCVSLESGQELKVTPEHRILTPDGWKEANSLKSGEPVLIQSGQGMWAQDDDLGADEGLKLGENSGLKLTKKDCHQDHHVPKKILSASKQTVCAYLKGLFNTRGELNYYEAGTRAGNKNINISLPSYSKRFLQEVQLMLLNLGIYGKIYRKDGENPKIYRHITSLESRKNMEQELYNNDYYELVIKKGEVWKFDQKVGFLPDAMIKENSKGLARSINEGEKFYARVEGVRYTGEEVTVYDINEPVTNSLIAQGMAVHNCGEQPLLPNESCNLGSINLARMVTSEGNIDYKRLKETVRTAVHFLDNVIDANRYPLKEIETNTKANRKIGLGVMGFGDMLFKLGVPYNSQTALETAEEVMKYIDTQSKEKSRELAEERGAFPNFEGSVYDLRGERPIRNATTTTIAPTGTISILCGVSSGIEPLFALAFTRNVMDNDKLIEVNPIFEQMIRERGRYSKELMEQVANNGSIKDIDEIPEDIKEIFVTSHDIKPEWHLKMQAAFQKYTDNAVSKTVNLPSDATRDHIENIYKLAFELDCKGVTVYRDKSREEQVLQKGGEDKSKSKKSATVSNEDFKALDITPRKRPDVTVGKTERIKTGCGNLYVTVNEDEYGLCELFASMGKSGGCAASQSEATARLISMALRAGLDVKTIIKELRAIRCPNPTWDGSGGMVLSCPDAIGIVLDKCIREKESGEKVGKSDNGIDSLDRLMGACPECGGHVRHESGCVSCFYCGYSKC